MWSVIGFHKGHNGYMLVTTPELKSKQLALQVSVARKPDFTVTWRPLYSKYLAKISVKSF